MRKAFDALPPGEDRDAGGIDVVRGSVSDLLVDGPDHPFRAIERRPDPRRVRVEHDPIGSPESSANTRRRDLAWTANERGSWSKCGPNHAKDPFHDTFES